MMMKLSRTENSWTLVQKAVRYIRDGDEFVQAMGDEGEQWWHDLAAKWPETEIIEFIDLDYTPEQLARLEEIQDIPGQYVAECEAYVMNGVVADIPPFAWKRTGSDLLATQEATAYLYEQNLMTLDALAALYEQAVAGGEPK